MSADQTTSAGVIVGIDLGTTNSLVAVCDERGARVLEGADGESIVPSVVRYERDDAAPSGVRTIVGGAAKARATEFPERTVASVKRLMGRSVGDAGDDLKYLGYRVVEDEHAQARVELRLDERTSKVVSPQEVSAVILRDLRARAERALGQEVRRAVVTVPAYFDDAQRQATRDAGRLAGLDVVRIVNEPTAAALAYGIGLGRESARNASPETVVVYDLGGGTFDVSVLRLTPAEGEGGTGFFQVLSTAGDTRLGGDDVDHMLVSLFVREIGEMLGGTGRRGLSREGEGNGGPARSGEGGERRSEAGPAGGEGEIDLSSFPPGTRRALKEFAESVKHRLSEEESASIAVRINESRVYERTITRGELEGMLAAWIERTMRACDRAMRDAGDAVAGGVDAVIMVGGSTRIPLVRARVADRFGLEPYVALDPDRVVALGAAVQASILSGTTRGQLLLDVIPLSLGIETVGGAVSKQIVRNSTVPARATEMYTTSVDGQTNIRLSVYQGEREMAEDCRRLGVFELRGIPPMPAGVPQVEVEFLVDANGVLSVSARERRSGKRASLQVIPNHGLTREEVERIEAESFEHAREDMTRHRVVDLVANARLDIKWIRERLEKHGGELEAGYRGELERRLSELGSLVERAAADWRAVSADELARAKQGLDEASVRLQEVSIAASLRADSDGGGPGA